MANVNKTDIVYWLGKICEALGGEASSESNKTDIVYWLECVYDALGGADKPQSVTDITALTDAQLDALKVGDAVAKVTGNQKHLYLVTYKGEGSGEGICMSYNAAGYGETVSYDRTDSGWAYNSTDVKTYEHADPVVIEATALGDDDKWTITRSEMDKAVAAVRAGRFDICIKRAYQIYYPISYHNDSASQEATFYYPHYSSQDGYVETYFIVDYSE